MKHHHTETDFSLEDAYPKLIRDKIPEIIAANGQKAVIHAAVSDDEYLTYLLKKVIEEAREVASATTDSNLAEEIADLREVIDAVLKLKNIKPEDIDAIQKEKWLKRGGFSSRLIMIGKGK